MKKLAIVYDWFDSFGGIERVLIELNHLFPDADFYTSFINTKKATWTKGFHIKTSFMQNLPFITQSRALSLPLFSYAFEQFNFDEYDIVLSITSSFAKGIITKPSTHHISWILTPTRYLWLYPEYYIQRYLPKVLQYNLLSKLRKWDYIASQRPDEIWSISNIVKSRVKKYYDRDSEVVYVPFDKEYWQKITSKYNPDKEILKLCNKPFYLVVSRLEPYKKVDLVIDTFKKLPQENLIIVGSGRMKQSLKFKVTKNITFLEKISDKDLAYLYSKALALIMPQEEDFGLTSLEAQTCGCKVITYKKSGAVETINIGISGITFDDQTVESLTNALESYKKQVYTVPIQTDHIDKFDKLIFFTTIKKRLQQFL